MRKNYASGLPRTYRQNPSISNTSVYFFFSLHFRHNIWCLLSTHAYHSLTWLLSKGLPKLQVGPTFLWMGYVHVINSGISDFNGENDKTLKLSGPLKAFWVFFRPSKMRQEVNASDYGCFPTTVGPAHYKSGHHLLQRHCIAPWIGFGMNFKMNSLEKKDGRAEYSKNAKKAKVMRKL